MARLFDGSTDKATASNPLSIGTGSIAMLVKAVALPSTGNRAVLAAYFDESVDGEPHGTNDKVIFLRPDGKVGAKIFDGGTKIAVSSGSLSLDTWTSVGITMDGTNLKVWIAGVNDGSLAAGAAFTGFSDRAFGLSTLVSNIESSTIVRANAHYAEIGLWSRVLASGDWTELAANVRPKDLTGGGANYYWPLLGDDSPEPEFSALDDFVLTGTTQSTHPTMAGGGTTVKPWWLGTSMTGGFLP